MYCQGILVSEGLPVCVTLGWWRITHHTVWSFSNHSSQTILFVPKQGLPLAPIWRKWSKPCPLGVEKAPPLLYCKPQSGGGGGAEWRWGGRHRHLEATQSSCTSRSQIQSFLRLPSRKGNRLPAVRCENSVLSLWLQSVNSLCLPGKKLPKAHSTRSSRGKTAKGNSQGCQYGWCYGGRKDRGLAVCLNMRFAFCSLCCQFISEQKDSHNSAVFRFKCGFCSLARTPRMSAWGKVILSTRVFLHTKILRPKDKSNTLMGRKRKLSI